MRIGESLRIWIVLTWSPLISELSCQGLPLRLSFRVSVVLTLTANGGVQTCGRTVSRMGLNREGRGCAPSHPRHPPGVRLGEPGGCRSPGSGCGIAVGLGQLTYLDPCQ